MKTKEIPKKQASDYCMSCFFKKGLFLQRQGCGNDAYQPIHFPNIQHVAKLAKQKITSLSTLPEDSTQMVELKFSFQLFIFREKIKQITHPSTSLIILRGLYLRIIGLVRYKKVTHPFLHSTVCCFTC